MTYVFCISFVSQMLWSSYTPYLVLFRIYWRDTAPSVRFGLQGIKRRAQIRGVCGDLRCDLYPFVELSNPRHERVAAPADKAWYDSALRGLGRHGRLLVLVHHQAVIQMTPGDFGGLQIGYWLHVSPITVLALH